MKYGLRAGQPVECSRDFRSSSYIEEPWLWPELDRPDPCRGQALCLWLQLEFAQSTQHGFSPQSPLTEPVQRLLHKDTHREEALPREQGWNSGVRPAECRTHRDAQPRL